MLWATHFNLVIVQTPTTPGTCSRVQTPATCSRVQTPATCSRVQTPAVVGSERWNFPSLTFLDDVFVCDDDDVSDLFLGWLTKCTRAAINYYHNNFG